MCIANHKGIVWTTRIIMAIIALFMLFESVLYLMRP